LANILFKLSIGKSVTSLYFCKKFIKMTSTAVQQTVSTEDVKQAIIALIKENNAEIKQLLGDLFPQLVSPVRKKTKPKQAPINGVAVKKERIPYSEMPFWKANPHLKPIEGPPNPNQKAFLEAIRTFATNQETQLTDAMIEGIDNI
jgi:hypothetical protein